jgi:RNA polymerase sigma-70 factor (ECF subfamily)
VEGGAGDSSSERDDRRLAASACRGDTAAFSELVARYSRPVYNLCLRYLPPADAEDMAQETFVRAFVHIRKLDPEKPLLPWLATIARRLCIDWLRKKKPQLRADPSRETIRDPEPDAERKTSSKQELALLAEGLKTLPEGQREAVALYHLDGLAYREIAEVLNVPEGTVMTWLHRGRAKLRAILSEQREVTKQSNRPR